MRRFRRQRHDSQYLPVSGNRLDHGNHSHHQHRHRHVWLLSDPPHGWAGLWSAVGPGHQRNTSITDRSPYIYGLPSGESNDQFSAESWNGRPFKVRAMGVGNAGANAAQSVQINLYQGSSATVGSNKKIGTTGTALAAVAGGAFNWMVEATLLWDSTSQILSGSYTANIAFGTVSQFTTTTVVPNVVTSVTAAGLVFNATIVLGNGAASTVQIKEFVADRV